MAVPDHIADDQPDPVVRERQRVVPVAADFERAAGGGVPGRDLDARGPQHLVGQQFPLQARGDAALLVADPCPREHDSDAIGDPPGEQQVLARERTGIGVGRAQDERRRRIGAGLDRDDAADRTQLLLDPAAPARSRHIARELHFRGVGHPRHEHLSQAPRAPVEAVDSLELGDDLGDQLRLLAGQPLRCLALAQRVVGPPAIGYVLEDQREAPTRSRGRGEDVEPAPHRLRSALEAHRLVPEGHTAVGLDPRFLEAGHQLPSRPPHRVDEAGHLGEQRIGLEEAVADRPSCSSRSPSRTGSSPRRWR